MGLVTLNGWLVIRNRLNYTHTNVLAKVQPHHRSVLIVIPTQKTKYLRLFRIVEFAVATRRAQVNSISWYFDDQVLAERRLFFIIAESKPWFLMRVEIKCGINEKQFFS